MQVEEFWYKFKSQKTYTLLKKKKWARRKLKVLYKMEN